ncbi:MAG: hypothetical protein CMJ78_02565, partial [Planctomycetaceae bacterium]|nr:hypothetical protein [Planctomycetaceae bacterium]
QNRIHQIQGKIRTSNLITLVVGVVALAAVAGYFYYGYNKANELLDNELLTSAAISMAEDQLPEVRRSVQEQIITSAPEWAAQLSDQAVSAMPKVRTELEDYVIEQTEDVLGQVEVMTADQFRRILQDNRQTLQEGFTALADDEDLSDATLQQIESALEKELQNDMQESAGTVLETLTMLNERIERLKGGVGLSAEEKIERRVLMRAKRLQLQEADPTMRREKEKEVIGIEKSEGEETPKEEAKPEEKTEEAEKSE